jgi:hypothetical protein
MTPFTLTNGANMSKESDAVFHSEEFVVTAMRSSIFTTGVVVHFPQQIPSKRFCIEPKSLL